jgi:short subunit dehydrogenase-like uncharacterized protein
MIGEAAVCLVQEAAAVSGGMWTPGAALGRRLLDRLTAHAGLTFAVEN